MTMIDDIKRDREAGTPGPWKATRNTAFWEIEVPEAWGQVEPGVLPYSIGDVCASDPGDTKGLQELNARRIARVPDMEAALIAADELATRVQQQQDGWPMRTDYITDALAAYRKATGADQ